MPTDDGLNVNIVNCSVIHGHERRGKTDSSAQLTELTSLLGFTKLSLEDSAVSCIFFPHFRKSEA